MLSPSQTHICFNAASTGSYFRPCPGVSAPVGASQSAQASDHVHPSCPARCSSWQIITFLPISAIVPLTHMLDLSRTQCRADCIFYVCARNDDGCLPPVRKVMENMGIHLAQKGFFLDPAGKRGGEGAGVCREGPMRELCQARCLQGSYMFYFEVPGNGFQTANIHKS